MAEEIGAGMPVDLPHVAARLFGAPLMVHPEKLAAILAGLAPRFGVATPPQPQAMDQQDEAGARQQRRSRPYAIAGGVAVVPMIGGLVARAGKMQPDSTELRSYARVISDLRTAMDDDAVRAVVLDIDSPGGEANGALEAAAAIRGMRGTKPIIAAVNHAAFSAAYALASAADRIVIPQSGGVGSIGVVCAHLDVTKADAKAGMTWTFVHAGERKLDGNPHVPLSDRARDTMQALVESTYAQFVAAVVAGRRMTAQAVRDTEAGVFFGQAAVDIGLADRIGTFEEAMAEALAMAAPPISGTGRGRPSAQHRPQGAKMDDDKQAGDPPANNPATPDLAAVREQAMADARKAEAARAEAIAGLCELAGVPAQAAAFIRDGKTEAEVRAALLGMKAAASQEGGEISAARPAGAGVAGGKADGTTMTAAAVASSWDRVGKAQFGEKWKDF